MTTGPIHNERELLLDVAEGNEKAFRQLFHLYAPQLYPMIFKVTGDKNVTEDILQETFLKLWLNRDKLPEIENPRAWILRIAYFQAFTFLRKKATHQKALDSLFNKTNFDTLRSDTEERMAWRSMQAVVKRAVSGMPSQSKKVYQLSREQGLTISEIAKQLNLSPQSVKNTLSRALKFIREYLAKEGYLFLVVFFMLIRYLDPK